MYQETTVDRAKCPSCGYEKNPRTIPTDNVVRFKSGKRKGEIKEIKDKTIEIDHDKPDFPVVCMRGTEEIGTIEDDCGYRPEFVELELLICPECGVVFSQRHQIGY